MILLDTSTAIAAINDDPQVVADRIAAQAQSEDNVYVSAIVLFELRFGIAKSRRRAYNETRIAHFLAGPVRTLAFDEMDAVYAGEVRAALKAAGTPIGPYDTLIAGQALRHEATLVTANGREFGRVEGLRWEDWALTTT